MIRVGSNVSTASRNRPPQDVRWPVVFLRSGKGKITVNGRAFEHYFVERIRARDGAPAAAGG